MKAIFTNLCPNCEGEINDVRLAKKLPCERCLPKEVTAESFDELVFRVYESLTDVKNYETIYTIVWRLKDFNELFQRMTGSKLWSAQRTWAKRLFLGRSFSIIAPTGIGKTAFGVAMALYLAREEEHVYFVLPTTTLLLQVKERMEEYAQRAGLDVRILAVHGKMGKKEKEEAEERIKKGDFDVLITSAQYLARKFDLLRHLKIDFAFIDDVDAFLKASRNIERILVLLGFTEEIIRVAEELVRAKIALVRRPNDEKLRKRIEELTQRIEEFKRRNETGQLVVASATGRARGWRVKIFRELLEFEVGSTRAQLRNVVNTYAEPRDIKEAVLKLVSRLGTGGLVFVPTDQGQEFAEELRDFLRERGIACDFATSQNATKVLEAFARGDIDVAIGMAAYYGTLVRGIDLPERVRYAIFTGVPKFRFALNLEGAPPGRIAFLLDVVSEYVKDGNLRALANRIRRYMREEDVERGREVLRGLLQRTDVLEYLKSRPDLIIEEERGQTYIVIPDAKTYIQASGRTSRMYAGGITKGLSVVLVDRRKAFDLLRRHIRIVYGEEFVHLSEIDIDKVLREIDEDRRRVREPGRWADPVKTVLFIVESPNKARTIASFFGRPSVYRLGNMRGYEVSTGRYLLTVMATRGHMFDLIVDRGFHGVEEIGGRFVPVYTTIKVCRRCGVQTTADVCPRCGSADYLEDAAWRVNALRLFALESDYVIVGTDPDTEGEKIAWDTYLAISPLVPEVYRAEFHEVTRQAILRALEEVRNINENRVNAQIVRRVEDRWIGFELSQKLWKVFGNRTLSAGRVQTPVLGWIIERYREHKESVAVFADVGFEGGSVVFETPFKSEREAEDFFVGKQVEVRLENVEETEINPPPPFTTDAMIREAGRVLGLGAKETMDLAQDLFEMGLITYHRTDSTHVSNAGIDVARVYIEDRFGRDLFAPRRWGEEGAHECIRPTRPMDVDQLIEYMREGEITFTGLTRRHLALYGLIFRRFMASQMRAARVVRADVVYRVDGLEKREERIIRVLEPGWFLVAGKKEAPVKEGTFPIHSVRAFRAAKIPLYTQADVVALMKERGIGRPSTYATIIQKLLERRYVMESREKRKLYPTRLGVRVYTYLTEKFPHLISEERTRELEAVMDAIEAGEKDYQEALREIYEEIVAVKDIF